MNRPLLLCLSLMGSAVHAQQNPLVGVWQISYPGASRVEDGVVTPIMATGTLTVEATADSLIATLVTDSSANAPARPPLRLTAATTPGAVVFLSQSKATLNINGESRPALVGNTWTLSAKGEVLSGTLLRTLLGMDAPPQEPQPITGHRRKG